MADSAEKKKAAQAQKYLEAKVGVFVIALAVVGVAVVMLLSAKKHVFEARVHLHAEFVDIQGLSVGAPVRLSGVNIGTVAKINFAKDRDNQKVQVELNIVKSAMERVDDDSIARIDSQGLLGDKIITIAPGPKFDNPLQNDATIKTAEPFDVNKVMEQAQNVVAKAGVVADGAAKLIEKASDPKTIANVRASIASVQKLLKATADGEGLAHALFYDKKTANDLSQLVETADKMAMNVNHAVASVNGILGATDANGKQLMNNLSLASKHIGEVAEQVRTSQVLANFSKASGDVSKATTDLAALTAQARSGQGTIGALMMDPTVYEQLVTILGGVQRSRILRAVVRYAISKGEGAQPAGKAVDEPEKK